MEFVSKMVDFVSKMMEFVLKMMDSSLKRWATHGEGEKCLPRSAAGVFIYINEESSIENEDSSLERMMILGRPGVRYLEGLC